MQVESIKQTQRQKNKRHSYWASKQTTKTLCLLKHVVFEEGFGSESKQVHSVLEFITKKKTEMFHFKIKTSFRMGMNVFLQYKKEILKKRFCF